MFGLSKEKEESETESDITELKKESEVVTTKL